MCALSIYIHTFTFIPGRFDMNNWVKSSNKYQKIAPKIKYRHWDLFKNI